MASERWELFGAADVFREGAKNCTRGACAPHLKSGFRVETTGKLTNLAPVGAPTAGDSGGQIGSTVGVFWAAPAIGPGEPFNTQLSAKIIF